MPVYEYKCEKGHLFDVIQSMSDDPVAECEKCGAPVQRVFHAPAVHFKGAGFYNTDYGKQKKGKAADNGGGSDSPDTKTETKTETKPEKKAESKGSDSKSKSGSD